LPAPGKVRKVKHHAAMAYRDLPQFITELRERQNDVAARARREGPLRTSPSCRSCCGPVIGSVELIIQPDANDVDRECIDPIIFDALNRTQKISGEIRKSAREER
jgi:hypothetical protein